MNANNRFCNPKKLFKKPGIKISMKKQNKKEDIHILDVYNTMVPVVALLKS